MTNPLLTPLLQDPSITEILINDFQNIFFESKGKLQKSNVMFESKLTFQNYVFDLLKHTNLNIDYDHPFCSFEFESCRYQIISPVLTKKDYALSIRKFHFNEITIESFLSKNTSTQTQPLILKILEEHKNFLVVGPTGSGKTSFLNACLRQLPTHERVVTLEDTPELQTTSPLCLQLYTHNKNAAHEFTLSHLIKETLRLRPDRIAVGEVRGPEAKELLMALSTGHRGSCGTLHAASAPEALMRLEMLIQLGAPQWSLETIRKMIHFGLDYIILVARAENGKRKIQQISKLAGLESSGFLLDDLI